MITPKLEALIWEGKAFFKTFVAGGSQRHNLEINNDRFIIITDITYFNSGSFPEDVNGENNTFQNMSSQGMNTQLTILGEKQVNRFLFRNSFNAVSNKNDGTNLRLLPNGHTTINCYLLHTTQVAFTFSFAQDIIAQTVGVTPGEFFALNIPIDYGRAGGLGVNVTLDATVQGSSSYVDLFGARATTGEQSKEFSFPVDALNNIQDTNRANSWAYPILHVNYVEILGLPNNIGQ